MLAEAADSSGLDAASDAVEVAETAVLLACVGVDAVAPSSCRRGPGQLARDRGGQPRAPLADVARTLAKRTRAAPAPS